MAYSDTDPVGPSWTASGRAGLSSPAQALGAGGEAAGQPGRVVDEGIGFSIR